MIDLDTSSKLMVTTRIRGLIKGGSEVAIGTLSQVDALKLLAATAGVEEYDLPKEGKTQADDQYHMACEVVELCSCLALTVFNQTTNLKCTWLKSSRFNLIQDFRLEWRETTIT